MTEDEAREYWMVLWKKTINEFGEWLGGEADLEETQLVQLDEALKKVEGGEEQKESILEMLYPILNQKQMGAAVERWSQLSLGNMEAVYGELRDKMTPDQIQVSDSLAKSL